MENKIDLIKLQIITNKIFDHIINTRNINTVDLSKNYYWEINNDQLYNVDSSPTDFTVGSLKDNLEFIDELLSPESLPVAYQFTEIAPILNYIGEILAKKLAKFGG